MKIILSILLLTFLFPQETVEPVLLEDETCEGTCFSDEEVQNIELHITELENKDRLKVQKTLQISLRIIKGKNNDNVSITTYSWFC